jgi:histidyl-tRNA synthetase
MHYGLGVLSRVRESGISAEIYPDQAKLKKQLDFGNKKQIPFTVVIGSDEMKSGNLVLKNMETGEQETLTIENLITKLR